MNRHQQTNSPQRTAPPSRGAIILATVILLAAGTGYRIAAARYARPADSLAMPPETLGRIATEFGDWVGRDAPLDQRIIDATDTDAHLSREYIHRRSGKAMRLWIAYGVRMRDLMPHRPEVCYPGSGWTLQDVHELQPPANNGPGKPMRLLSFTRGGLDSRGVKVLNWYLVDGEHTPDVALLRSKAWKPPSRSAYVLQVQVSADSGGAGAMAESDLLAFAAELAPAIERLMAEVIASGSEASPAANPPAPSGGGSP